MTTQETPAQAPHTFQVDLRGLVDLLSQHLYASPRAYVRELLQNGVDAITARRALDAGAPGTVHIEATGTALRVTDSGVGLSEPEVHQLLATIGRSSKRDELQEARKEFLGQFGIGLLACFVVAETIRVVSRSARTPDALPVEWVARGDGSYTVRTLEASEHPEPGTTVHLEARRGSEQWFEASTVADLAADFGALLPHDVRVGDEPITGRRPPWEAEHTSPTARATALSAYCQDVFGFAPLDSIELDLPLVGIRGVAYVLPGVVSPAQRGGHRVHLKGMLLTDRAETLLPDWAFFVRCVLDTDSLRPTASREQLYEDETLAAVRDALGDRVRAWLAQLATATPERLRRFLAVHHLGVKALALHDDDVLRTMLPWLPFETSEGELTLDDLARRHRTEQTDQAMLANLAAEALDRAGEKVSAELAYERAADLWAEVGDARRQLRATRAWAWTVRHRDAAEAGRIMTGATRVCEAALADSTDPEELSELRTELPETLEQHARVIADEDLETGRFRGLYDGGLTEAASLAARAESLLRESDDAARWCQAALLAAELAVEAGETAHGLELVAAVEAKVDGDEELSGFRGHAGWIRDLVAA
jgi:HSP90 family molecular chaperone